MALGSYAVAGGAAFVPYLADTLATLRRMADYFHEQASTSAGNSALTRSP